MLQTGGAVFAPVWGSVCTGDVDLRLEARMKILLTGASSFTGYWFARALSSAGHYVVAPLRQPVANYVKGVRAERVKCLAAVAEIVGDCAFGGDHFLDVARAGGYDLLCHHAARVGNYRSPDFNIAEALAENTANLRSVLATLAAGGLSGVVLTGSMFEQNEGAGDTPLVAFSPYGLSKGFTADVFSLRCREIGIPYGKFVIPTPFGRLEEPRFCDYLLRSWKARQVARVNTPAYVRDNIHVDLLAAAYVRFAHETAGGLPSAKLNPSGYLESQGAFAERIAAAMRPRLGLDCELELAVQTDFSEPMMRVNTDPAARYVTAWKEEIAWDLYAENFAHTP
jgi:nucleoside-diphosphate-sugar epimerase